MARAHVGEDHSQQQAQGAPPAFAQAMTEEMLPAQRLPDGSLYVPKLVQRRIGLRHVIARLESRPRGIELNGRVVSEPNASGQVQASQAGRIDPGPRGLPRVGQRVAKGQTLAYLRPTSTSLERGAVEAQLTEIEAQLALAEAKFTRYEQLSGVVAQAAIDAARVDVEALHKRRIALKNGLAARLPLAAPIAGVITEAQVVAGQIVDAKEPLFEIIDPQRLAVEALAYDPALLEQVEAAEALTPAGVLPLEFIGASRRLREQALPLLFRIRPPAPTLAIGQPLTVIVRLKLPSPAVALPRDAIIMDSTGKPAVWIRDGAERFVLRPVRTAPLSGREIAVLEGVAAGERVVTQGAAALALVR